MEEKSEVHIYKKALMNTYYGNLRNHAPEEAAYITLRWYEAELQLAEADRIPERMEKAREYIEFLKRKKRQKKLMGIWRYIWRRHYKS